MKATQWMTTLPKPGTPATGFDAGQRGWRVHAVEADETEKFSEIGSRPAACGLRPRHGWGMDLFIDRRCARCERALGLPLSPENVFAAELRARIQGGTKNAAGTIGVRDPYLGVEDDDVRLERPFDRKADPLVGTGMRSKTSASGPVPCTPYGRKVGTG